jgi:AcrR family transcriptional regulator
MGQRARGPKRTPLSREIVLRAAVALADDAEIDSVSMRNLAQELGVVPMALYKHVANKEELLDGMVDLIIGEFDPPTCDAGWKDAIRQRALSARQAMLRHRWAPEVIKSRTHAAPVVLDYLNSLIDTFRSSGFSADLIHQVMHALGSRTWGFTLEVFFAPPPREDSTVGQGCDHELEFAFGLESAPIGKP